MLRISAASDRNNWENTPLKPAWEGEDRAASPR